MNATSKDKYGLIFITLCKKGIKIVLDPLDNNDDVVHENFRLPEQKLHCSVS